MAHAQQIKIRIGGVDHISKTRADAKKPMLFSESAPLKCPKTGLISEAPNCMLTSVICCHEVDGFTFYTIVKVFIVFV